MQAGHSHLATAKVSSPESTSSFELMIACTDQVLPEGQIFVLLVGL